MLLCYLIYPYIFQIVDSARDAIDGEIRLLSIVSAITVLALVIALYEKDMFGNVNIALLRLPVFIAGCFYGRSSYEKRKLLEMVDSFCVIRLFAHHASKWISYFFTKVCDRNF